MKILFLGNSYTHRGPVPMLFHRIAVSGGHRCQVYSIAPEAASLRDHLLSDEVEHAMAFGGWDALVLQEQSVRPTARVGDPGAFATDAIALSSGFLGHSPNGAIWLTQTWARHVDHMNWLQDPTSRFYPYHYDQPREMRDELRVSTRRVAQRIREESGSARVDTLMLGDAWADYDAVDGAVRLHDIDGSHANTHGQWLSAALWHRVLFGPLPVGWGEGIVDESVRVFCQQWAHQ